MSDRNSFVFARNRSTSSVDDDRSSIARSDPAATTGVMLFENRYGRDRCRSNSTISRRPLV